MYAFLLFFYFFVFVALFVTITRTNDRAVLFIVTKDLTPFPVNDDEHTDMEIDEGNDQVEVTDCVSDRIFQIEMRTKTKDEKILYELHSFLSEHDINEETNTMVVENDEIIWDVKYKTNVYEAFYDALIKYINENFLSENLIVYLNGKNVTKCSAPISLIK